MGKMKRDYSQVERKETTAYSGDVPKPGIYDGVLSSCDDHTSGEGNSGTKWVFEITQEPYVGWPGWVYTNETTAAWKEMQILEATGVMKPGETSLDMTHEQIVKKAGPVRLKVKNEQYEGETKGKITTIMAPPGGAVAKKGKKEKSGSSEGPF